jgi:hypothetical protein
VAVVQYTSTHKQYTEHNDTEYTELIVLISMLVDRGNVAGVVTGLCGLGLNSRLGEQCFSPLNSSNPAPLLSGYRVPSRE